MQAVKELRKYIRVDEARIITKIVSKIREIRYQNETKVKTNKDRPSWNNNTTVKNSLTCEEDNKFALEDNKRAKLVFESMIRETKNIKDHKTLNNFRELYDHYLDSLVSMKLDLIRTDFTFKQWNISTTAIMAANKFKKGLKAK